MVTRIQVTVKNRAAVGERRHFPHIKTKPKKQIAPKKVPQQHWYIIR